MDCQIQCQLQSAVWIGHSTPQFLRAFLALSTLLVPVVRACWRSTVRHKKRVSRPAGAECPSDDNMQH